MQGLFSNYFLKATKKFQVKQNYNETVMLKLSAQACYIRANLEIYTFYFYISNQVITIWL